MPPTRLNPSEIATALLGRDNYIVLQSDQPPDWAIRPQAFGMTGRNLDTLLHAWLVERGEWRDRRPAIYIADQLISQVADAEAAGNFQRSIEVHDQLLAAIVVHEVGHIVENGIDLTEQTSVRQLFAQAVACTDALEDHSELPPFFMHSASWVRLSIHAAYRAETTRMGIPAALLILRSAVCVCRSRRV